MTGRSPVRLLAPLALAAAVVALFAVVSSSREADSSASGAGERQAATATPKQTPSSTPRSSDEKTYTVKPGDTPSAIAQRENVDLSALLEANLDADPAALTPGQKLELP